MQPEEIDPVAPCSSRARPGFVDALEIGVALAKRYGVKLTADNENNRGHFANVRALAAFVSSQRGAQAA